MHRLVRLARAYAIDVLAVAILVAATIEIWAAPLPGSHATLTVMALFATLPLLLRRRAPLAAPLTVFAALVVGSLLEPQALFDSSFFFFGALLATWTVAEGNPNRQGLVGYAAAIGTLVFVVSRFPEDNSGADDYVWVTVFFTAAWLAGFAVGHRARQAREAESRLRLTEERRRVEAATAVARERARIARELHDVVAHSISVMTVQAAGVRRLLRDDQGRERDALAAVEETGREALAEMRRLLGMMRSDGEGAELAPQPGLGRLQALAAETRDGGFPVELTVEGDPYEVPAGVDLSAYRVVEEALENAGGTGAAGARVVVRYEPDAIALEIDNDGDGARRGLVGMRERVAFYGGTLEAGQDDGRYVVRARIPVQTSEHSWRSAS
jgi:signal transduction histidine kinase